jgi:hypothetical protein
MSIAMMARVWSHSTVTDSSELLVLLAIADWADDSGVAYPKVKNLAAKSRLSERQVQRCLVSIMDRGELKVERNAGPSMVNLYRVTISGHGDNVSPVTPVTPSNGDAGDTKGVTPVTPSRVDLSPEPSPEPSPGPGAHGDSVSPPKQNKYAAFIDEVRRLGLNYRTTPTDAKAVNDTDASAEEIAEAVAALMARKWGDDYMRRQPLRNIIPAMGAWFNRKGRDSAWQSQVSNKRVEVI